MVTSRQPPRQVPPPDRREGERRATYARFIPGEEVQGAKAWNPDNLGDTAPSPFAPMRPGTPAVPNPAAPAAGLGTAGVPGR
ncbi:hypothetical protein EXH51_17935, partial [Pelomonas saccharophila]|nr:hypothetical protein [Roseateles saccharophilus]